MRAEPIAVEFANTRSSSRRDRIATISEWRIWIDAWPGFRDVGFAIDGADLEQVRLLRDRVQALLRDSVLGSGESIPGHGKQVLEAAHEMPAASLRWRAGRVALAVAKEGRTVDLLTSYLAWAAVETVATGSRLAVCEGHDCYRLFTASRSDRRWCDSNICGNRARVAAHSHRKGGA
jgi:predicted RNA-binding Zn ribbon-like protein